jgi:hypothetical protein
MAKTHFVDRVTFAPGGGWSVLSNSVRTSLLADPLRTFEVQVLRVGTTRRSIQERKAA